MRSASSSTKKLTEESEMLPEVRKSMSLPGVAMRMSTPWAMSPSCSPLSAPP